MTAGDALTMLSIMQICIWFNQFGVVGRLILSLPVESMNGVQLSPQMRRYCVKE